MSQCEQEMAVQYVHSWVRQEDKTPVSFNSCIDLAPPNKVFWCWAFKEMEAIVRQNIVSSLQLQLLNLWSDGNKVLKNKELISLLLTAARLWKDLCEANTEYQHHVVWEIALLGNTKSESQEVTVKEMLVAVWFGSIDYTNKTEHGQAPPVGFKRIWLWY